VTDETNKPIEAEAAVAAEAMAPPAETSLLALPATGAEVPVPAAEAVVPAAEVLSPPADVVAPAEITTPVAAPVTEVGPSIELPVQPAVPAGEAIAIAETAAAEVAPVAEVAAAIVTAAPAAAAPAPARKTAKTKAAAAEPPIEVPVEPKSDKMEWYILKVQSNREESIKDGLLRRVKREGLDRYFGEVIIPTEKVTEVKGGKKRVMKRKLYPGYLVVQMEINDDTWFLVRETTGIGDFTGAAGRPAPMLAHEVSRILARQEEKSEKAPKLNIAFKPGDQVKINDGTFENFEGHVESIDETNGRVTVMINIFGRSTPVQFEYWQLGSV
jgi:transcriptional antiterminator NusG